MSQNAHLSRKKGKDMNGKLYCCTGEERVENKVVGFGMACGHMPFATGVWCSLCVGTAVEEGCTSRQGIHLQMHLVQVTQLASEACFV